MPMALPDLQSRKLEGHLADLIPSIAKTVARRSSSSHSLYSMNGKPGAVLLQAGG